MNTKLRAATAAAGYLSECSMEEFLMGKAADLEQWLRQQGTLANPFFQS
jgi:hypothetical protein